MCLLLLLLRYEVVRVALCRDVCATTVFSYLLITSSSHSVSQKFGDTYSSFLEFISLCTTKLKISNTVRTTTVKRRLLFLSVAIHIWWYGSVLWTILCSTCTHAKMEVRGAWAKLPSMEETMHQWKQNRTMIKPDRAWNLDLEWKWLAKWFADV